MPDRSSAAPRKKKRAIALGGGGPAAGFLIGALMELERAELHFDVWALSCIGAWVGIHYHQVPTADKAEKTYEFFAEHAFRDTDAYRAFPVNKAFAPDMQAVAAAWTRHALSPQTWADVLAVGGELGAAARGWHEFLTEPQRWFSRGDVNAHLLNDVLALHPLSRFLTSMGYQSAIDGLSRVHYEDSSFLRSLAIPQLNLLGSDELGAKSRAELLRLVADWPDAARAAACADTTVPEIYHNAWRCRVDEGPDAGDGQLRVFNNKWALYHRRGATAKAPDALPYLPISRASLCACSALPYVLQPVSVPNDDGALYTEGALVDTVNFRNLVEDHPDLDEIWVCRIVDDSQVRRPRSLHDSLSNLCEQFAAEVGENDVELFKHHLRKAGGRVPRVVELPLVSTTQIGYRWDRANLEAGVREGRAAVRQVLDADPMLALHETRADPWPRRVACCASAAAAAPAAAATAA